VIPFEAHGDGFAQENVYASVGNRKMAMFIKINPPIITSENLTDRYIQFRFYDANTNSSLHNVSFFLNVTKGDQILGHDLFYTSDGFMTIKFQPGGKEGEFTVYGDKFPINDAWYSPTDQVTVVSPILSQGGLYHFNMNLLSFDFPNENLPPYNGTVMFDSYLSVGDFSSTSINYNSMPYNTTIVSYYDKVANINFDPSKLSFSWSMPFDWDPSKYQGRAFLVHEELRIPDSFKEFVNNPAFAATVNGNPMNPSKIVLDPYSITNTTIVHLFVYKNDIQNLSATIRTNATTMDFAVTPAQTNATTSTDIFSDFGGWEIRLGWSPQIFSAGATNNLKLSFYDQLTGQPVQSDVNYDLKILDDTGGTIISKSNLVAKGGTDVQSFDMPSNGIYLIKVSVTSFFNNDILDSSRPGTARGTVVVPEFGEIVTWVLAAALISIIVVSTRSGLRFSLR
jgi:predicted secreted protein with PEFG-CTERM motif